MEVRCEFLPRHGVVGSLVESILIKYIAPLVPLVTQSPLTSSWSLLMVIHDFGIGDRKLIRHDRCAVMYSESIGRLWTKS